MNKINKYFQIKEAIDAKDNGYDPKSMATMPIATLNKKYPLIFLYIASHWNVFADDILDLCKQKEIEYLKEAESEIKALLTLISQSAVGVDDE